KPNVVVLIALGVGLISIPIGSHAAPEQRCDELGSNCVCARSLSATSWVQSSSPDFYYEANQDTSDAKLCSIVTADGRATVWTPDRGSISVVPGLNGISALQHAGKSFVVEPSDAMKASMTGRVGIRYYFHLNPGYESTGDGGCTNDKYIQWGDYFTAFN